MNLCNVQSNQPRLQASQYNNDGLASESQHGGHPGEYRVSLWLVVHWAISKVHTGCLGSELRHIPGWNASRVTEELWTWRLTIINMEVFEPGGIFIEKGIRFFITTDGFLTCWKVTRVALERNIEKCAAFTFQMGLLYSPEQLVFVDECSADQWMGRGYGYARQGRRAVEKAFFVWGRR